MKRLLLSPVIVFAGFASLAVAAPPSDSGALDATFGNAGKVQLAPVPDIGIASHALDAAVQADGKVVFVGYDAINASCGGGTPCVSESWRITRLAANGSLDTAFGGEQTGTRYYGNGLSPTRAQGVAVRSDGHVVVAGTYCCHTDGSKFIVVLQLKADGTPDDAFGDGALMAVSGSASGDDVSLARMILDSDGSIDLVGTYRVAASNSNQFFFDRVAAGGRSDEPFRFIFGGGANQDAHAMDVAIDRQGRYVVAGYAPGPHGYDCAVIRITRDLYDVDRTFGHTAPDDYGYQTIAFDYAGDDNDVCNAVAIFPGGHIALGGHATADAGNGTYQAAALAELDDAGQPASYFSGGLLYPTKFAFAYGPTSASLDSDIARLVVDAYDTKYPQLLAIGSGYQSGIPYGQQFGIARVNPPQTYSNFALDGTFAGDGTLGLWFVERPDGVGLLRTNNGGFGAAFGSGQLVVAGDTQVPAGTQAALARLVAFDGIFRNGFDTPSY